MNKTSTNFRMRSVFLAFALSCISFFASAQSFNYVNGTLDITINAYNPCLSTGSGNGYLTFTVNAADGNQAVLVFLDGPAGNDTFGQTINQGATFSFNPAKTLPNGTYQIIIRDVIGNFTINTFVDPAYAPIVMTNIASPSLSEDIKINNGSCTPPLTGQIQSSISGGSQVLAGGGLYTYQWSADNGFPGLTLKGITNGTTPLNLATLLATPGLSGGTYTLKVKDSLSVCPLISRSFVLTDPSPTVYTVTTSSPQNICAGDNITVTLNNSDGNTVSYEIFRNASATGITFPGTGTGPFVMTFPSTGFVDNDVIRVRATDGFCNPAFMTPNLLLNINPLPTAVTSGGGTVCAGSPLPNVTFTFTGTPPFNFTYTDGISFFPIVGHNALTYTIASATAGTYSVTNLSDNNSCLATSLVGSVQVIVNPLPTATITASPSPICSGQSSTLTFALTGTGPFDVSYNDGTTTFNLVGISNGHTVSVSPALSTTYTITNVTDATTCIGVAGSATTINVNIPPSSATLSGTATICAGQSTNISVAIVGGLSPYSFTIDNGVGLITGYVSGGLISVGPGVNTTYTIIGNVTDAAGCTVTPTGSAIITVNPIPVATISSSPSPICSGQSSTLTFALTGTAPFNVSYNDGTTTFNLVGINTGHTVSVNPAVNTTYTIVSVTDATTCIGVAGSATTINVNIPPSSATLSGTTTICAGQSTNLSVAIVGGLSPYTFTINNGVGLITGYVSGGLISVGPGVNTTYTITGNVTDAAGCTVTPTGSAIITVNPLPTATISSSPSPICSGQSSTLTFALTGTAPFNVSYNDGTTTFNLVGISTGHTVSVNPAVSTTYTIVSVSDATTCIGVGGSATTINVNIPPSSATLSGTSTICAGQTTNLSVAIVGGLSPYSFTIDNGVGLITGYASGGLISVGPGVNTTYTITGNVTDAAGCTVIPTGSAIVTVNPLPTATITASPSPICSGQSSTLTFALTGTGPFNVSYNDGTTTFNLVGISNGNTVSVSPALNTTYTIVSVSDATTCVGVGGSAATVTVNPIPVATISASPSPICSGQSSTLTFALTGTAPFNVSYNDGTTTFNLVGISNGHTVSVSPALNTTYTIASVSDATTCAGVGGSAATVVVNPIPVATISSSPSPICSGQSSTLTFALTGTGPFDVSYNDGTTTFNLVGISNGHTVSVNPAVSTTYTIVSVDDATTCIGVGGSATTINVNIPPSSATLSGTATICAGQSTNLSVAIVGGLPPYSFTIDNGVGLIAGYVSGGLISVGPGVNTTYSITGNVTDAAGCTVTPIGSAIITVNPIPVATITASPSPICSGQSSTLTFALTGTGPFDVSYNDGTTTFNLVGISNGNTVSVSPALNTTYTVVSVSDATTCAGVGGSAATVTVNPSPVATITASPSPICSGQSSTLTFALTGTGPFDVSYNDGTTTFNLTGISNGHTVLLSPALNTTYTIVSVSDATTCAGVAGSATTVVVNPIPSPTLSGIPTVCSGTANVIYSTEIGQSNYAWSVSAGGVITAGGTATDNTVTVTWITAGAQTVSVNYSSLGCSAALPTQLPVTVNALPTATLTGNNTICIGASSTLTFTLTGVGPWSVIYSDGTTNFPIAFATSPGTVTPTAPIGTTTYSLVSVSDAQCGAGTTSGTAVVTVNPIPGDQVTFGADTWLGYVYTDAGPPITAANFAASKYRGFIDETDIASLGFSSYNTVTDAFNLNLSNFVPMAGPNVCGSFLDRFSVRYKMTKTLPVGIYTFTVGADDGVRLLVDGVNVITPAAFGPHAYQVYTATVCITAGSHNFEIEYFEAGGFSRVSFDYQLAPAPVAPTPVSVCVGSATPTLTVSSADPGVLSFRWYTDAALTNLIAGITPPGSSYIPAPVELDMSVVGSTDFFVTAVYACGEGQAAQVTVDVVNGATITLPAPTVQICQTGGVIDLTTLVSALPGSGNFTFAGTGVTTSPNFDPTLVAVSTSILVDYTVGTCVAPQQILVIDVINTATVTVPVADIDICQSSGLQDLTLLVSATPLLGSYTFTGAGVTGTDFDPSAQSGLVPITVDYNVGGPGGCSDSKSFNFNVTTNAVLTIDNTSNPCPNDPDIDLRTLVTAVPAGGTFTFVGTGVTGNFFDPSGSAGSTVFIQIFYDQGGCTALGTVQIDVKSVAACGGGGSGNCSLLTTIQITPTLPTCSAPDGGELVFTFGGLSYEVILEELGDPLSGQTERGSVVSFDQLTAGTYLYTIRDLNIPANTCVNQSIYRLDAFTQVNIDSAYQISDATCFGGSDGNLKLAVNGTTTGKYFFTYVNNGIESSPLQFTPGALLPIGLPANDTDFIIIKVDETAALSCPDTVMVRINYINPEIFATITTTPATCNNNDGGIAISNVSGGSGTNNFEYSIDGGLSFQAGPFPNLPGGTYSIIVRDKTSGCEQPFTGDVTFPGFVNFTATPSPATCFNFGLSGSILVNVLGGGGDKAAISTDPNNEPAASEYLDINLNSILFDNLATGTYYIYVQSQTASCPTRSAAISVNGVIAVNFDINPVCDNNEVSLILDNMTGAVVLGELRYELYVYDKLNPGVFVTPGGVPASLDPIDPNVASIRLDYNDPKFAFLKTPGVEYLISLYQIEPNLGCPVPSPDKNYTTTRPVYARADPGKTFESYDEMPTGKMSIVDFDGGFIPYKISITLDSAKGSTTYVGDGILELVEKNSNLEFQKDYVNIPAGRYLVHVEDSIGCAVEFNERVPLDIDLFIPNIFTPNEGADNPVFFIRNLDLTNANKLVVKDRWGLEVFSTNKYDNKWDGAGLSDGIYYYTLQTPTETKKGWVEILRGSKP